MVVFQGVQVKYVLNNVFDCVVPIIKCVDWHAVLFFLYVCKYYTLAISERIKKREH